MIRKFLTSMVGLGLVAWISAGSVEAHGHCGGFGHCGWGGGCRGFGWGYPAVGFGIGFGYGYGWGYPYYGYPYYGYGLYGGYAAPVPYAGPGYPYSAGYGAGGNGVPPAAPGSAYPRAPLNDNGAYPYNGDPGAVPLPAPAPRQLPPNMIPEGAANPTTSFLAFGAEAANVTAPRGQVDAREPGPAHESPRLTYPAYGDPPADVTIVKRSKRD